MNINANDVRKIVCVISVSSSEADLSTHVALWPVSDLIHMLRVETETS